ncbi:MAG: hypothetical protein Q7K42_03515 [Candidatus Diapherotrites archaeon]|nr:hypothetical protein [Candidatus Diapherotrites archaeon]
MGNEFQIQGCLRLPKEQIPKVLEIGKECKFRKEGHRIYQINVPLNLHTEDWKALGRCVVLQYTIGKGRTEGTFVLVRIFDKQEAEFATKNFVSDEEVQFVLKKLK